MNKKRTSHEVVSALRQFMIGPRVAPKKLYRLLDLGHLAVKEGVIGLDELTNTCIKNALAPLIKSGEFRRAARTGKGWHYQPADHHNGHTKVEPGDSRVQQVEQHLERIEALLLNLMQHLGIEETQTPVK